MSDRLGVPPPCQLVSLTTPHEGTPKLLTANRETDVNTVGQQAQIVLTLLRTLLGDCQGSGKYTRRQNIERYRRLLKSATDKQRRDYLNRLILEEQQKQKDAGDTDYQS